MWWLRTDRELHQNSFATVSLDGDITWYGFWSDSLGGVRPALWLCLKTTQ